MGSLKLAPWETIHGHNAAHSNMGSLYMNTRQAARTIISRLTQGTAHAQPCASHYPDALGMLPRPLSSPTTIKGSWEGQGAREGDGLDKETEKEGKKFGS